MYDVIVIGSGPGGYAAAIRASQLGKKTAIVEAAELGGVCLNWGCIPTKALLKSATVLEYAKHASEYGIEIESITTNLEKIVERSRAVAAAMSKGVEYLMKKNNITVITGRGAITAQGTVKVGAEVYEAENVIIATGARPRELPSIPVDGERVITSKQALVLKKLPATMVVIGSGAIGVEFATFYNTLGVKVTVIEYAENVAPLEDEEISKLLDRALRKSKIATMTSTAVTKVETTDDGCRVYIQGKKGEQTIDCDVVLSAVGISANIENIGLEEVGIATERGKIVVNENYETSRRGIYAIGDVIATPALAHVASAEAIHAAEHIAGLNPKPINYDIIPSCIYTTPEVSSVGLTEKQALEKGYELRIGKFPYTASGKATAAGNRDGLVKLIFDSKTDIILGAHLIGLNVTELVAEPTLAMAMGVRAVDLIKTIHPHPTMAEAVMEAAAAAHNEAIHL
ncbi:Dihydrolipoamide dehydrogenase of branched-chain alpha-keto acid dehydrogenase [Mucinivorans hirudinis]|uniref:Dihydrolipoyl dehydrogenase n=1 Tax=Mucinivorans hirudinis TaxID=1433126 RepID=A0A060RA74_9BACT|nr:Dihydrolipoamide dehydrogenase of branched-chain alpha-keto acid dehydrogenase [Mucinivorans hirudinis]